MNYEILLAFMRYICPKARCARYREGMYQLHELLFLYNYAWIEIDESWDVVPRKPKYDYPPGNSQLWCHRAFPRAA